MKRLGVSKMVRVGVAAVASLALLTACDGLLPGDILDLGGKNEAPQPPPPAQPPGNPPPRATATPVRPTPKPTTPPAPQPTEPPPAAPQQAVSGRAVIHIRGINRLPFRPNLDTIIAATLTWELSGADKRVPIAEISIRGTRPRPCLQRPCNDDAGLVVRVTANADYDGGQRDESRHCGSGVNYHYRLALGPLGPDGGIDVAVEWDANGLRAATPVVSVFIAASRPGSFGFGRFIAGTTFRHGERGFGWDQFSIQRHGGGAELMSFSGQSGRRVGCP